MSNPVYLIATTFASPCGSGSTHGFRMYDNEAKCYDNNSETLITDDLELLDYALTVDDKEVKGMLDFVQEYEKGMNINDQYYDWDEIKGCFP
jgi:hypothetical protein